MKRSLSIAVTAGLALSLVACSGGSKSSGSSTPGTDSSTPPVTPSSAPPSSSTPPPVVPSTPEAPKPRTKAELTKALLALPDLPAGFSIDPDDSDDGTRLSSKDPRCAGALTLFNSMTAPGARVSAHRLFSGGQNGPSIQETLDAMGSTQAVAALITRTRTAVRACHTAKLRIPGVGTSTVAISEVSAPEEGTNPVAVRFAASTGPLAGFEVIFVITGLNDVVLGMGLDSEAGIEDPVADAYAKATKVLGTAKTGT